MGEDDLDFAAQEEMKRHQPRDADQQDNLPEYKQCIMSGTGGLCQRQIRSYRTNLLDNSNQIIGGRSAWMPQENSWFVSYHKQICEEFLVQWFSFGTYTKQEK